ncbi:MAG: hypothetical protein APR54_08960 [Candidatus Cloacimonas sp. SDB]|nr:MAG: hypothetical protein APR54_08960 [Candidatus Cloacimonas sp. SDB]
MKKEDGKAIIGLILAILLGFGIALAGSWNGITYHGLPLFGLLVAFAFLIQWIAFIPAFLLQTERFYDIVGSLTYIALVIISVCLSPIVDGRSALMLILVMIWAVRLGSFLFRRVLKAGKDGRFDEIKPHFFRFLTAWTLQALWITFTLSAALIVITTSNRKELDLFALFGFLVWIIGFTLEAVADLQKSRFKTDPTNNGKFINTGLWSRSRHPNYFGEIMLWTGVLIIALPVLKGWNWVALVSPVFVAILLTQISGIPILEKRADQKWGGQEDYETYKQNTPVLIPRLSAKNN